MAKSKYDVVSLGGATRDIIFYTSDAKIMETPKDLACPKLLAFEYGAKIISQKVYFGLGGGGCNTAVSFAHLGLKTANFIIIGRDREGDSIIKDLDEEKVDTRFVRRDWSLSTGFSFIAITERTKDHVAFLYRGANDNLIFPRNASDLFEAKWIYVSSLTGRHWPENAESIIKLVDKTKIKLAWNPGETQLAMGQKRLLNVLKATELLSLNLDESIGLALTAKMDRKKIKDPRILITEIQKWGPKMVAITLGKKGAYVYDGKKIYFSQVISVPVVDTTGAGDCFGSSFVAGMIRFKGDIQKSVKLGMVNTASLVQKVGAEKDLVYWKDIKNKFIK